VQWFRCAGHTLRGAVGERGRLHVERRFSAEGMKEVLEGTIGNWWFPAEYSLILPGRSPASAGSSRRNAERRRVLPTLDRNFRSRFSSRSTSGTGLSVDRRPGKVQEYGIPELVVLVEKIPTFLDGGQDHRASRVEPSKMVLPTHWNGSPVGRNR